MVDRVIEGGKQAESGNLVQAVRVEDHPGSDTQQNDPDVFYTMEAKQTFEIMLHECIHHT